MKNKYKMKNFINILCVIPNKIMLDFCNQLYDYFQKKNLYYTIYITVDSPVDKKEYKDTEKYKFIIIDHLEATKKGYKDSLLRYYHREISKLNLWLLTNLCTIFLNTKIMIITG